MKLLKLLACFFMSVNFLIPVQAEEADSLLDGNFHLYDAAADQKRDLGSYASFAEARDAFASMKDSYGNLCIEKDGSVYQAELAVVSFAVSNACDVNDTYTSVYDGSAGYLNGCYGNDGAYVSTSGDGGSVQFEVAGVKGWMSRDQLTIIPVEDLNVPLSSYVVRDGKLYHQIKGSLDSDHYIGVIALGTAPSGLQGNTVYYSYDGHYFYKSVEDLLQGQNAVNSEPYYNYYQFVSHRTISTVSEAELSEYFLQDLNIDGPMTDYVDDDVDSVCDIVNRSQYYDNLSAFFQYQYEYGANALMMLALSANESAMGRSSLAYTRNNLFSHAAYDSDVEKNASRYFSVNASVYSHARYYISGSYCSPLKDVYHGGFFGNKASGMSVAYASDPYWGEKAASYYMQFDQALGAKDYRAYGLGIKTAVGKIDILRSASETDGVLYTSPAAPDYAVVILGDAGDYWQIASDSTLDAGKLTNIAYDYDWQKDIGYVRKADVQIVMPALQSAPSGTYVNVAFEGNGGTFIGDAGSISYSLPQGMEASCIAPSKENALFTGWDLDTSAVSQDTIFTAQYKDVSDVQIETMPPLKFERNDRLSLKNGTLLVTFADGSQERYPMTMSMVSGYDMSAAGEQTVTVSFAGKEFAYTIFIDAQQDALRNDLKTQVNEMLDSLSAGTQVEESRILALKENMDENLVPYLTQAKMRALDLVLYQTYDNRIAYIMDENDMNFGISGLCVSLPLGNSLKKPKFMEDIVTVHLQDSVSEDAQSAFEKAAASMQYDVTKSFTVSVAENEEVLDVDRTLIYALDKPADDTYVYQVLHLEENGDVKICPTMETETRVSFMSDDTGEYAVIVRKAPAHDTAADVGDTLRFENNSTNYRVIFQHISIGLLSVAGLMLLIHWLHGLYNRHLVRKRQEQRHAE